MPKFEIKSLGTSSSHLISYFQTLTSPENLNSVAKGMKEITLKRPMLQLLVSSAVLVGPSQETAATAWSPCSRSCSGGVQSRLQSNGTRCTIY